MIASVLRNHSGLLARRLVSVRQAMGGQEYPPNPQDNAQHRRYQHDQDEQLNILGHNTPLLSHLNPLRLTLDRRSCSSSNSAENKRI